MLDESKENIDRLNQCSELVVDALFKEIMSNRRGLNREEISYIFFKSKELLNKLKVVL